MSSLSPLFCLCPISPKSILINSTRSSDNPSFSPSSSSFRPFSGLNHLPPSASPALNSSSSSTFQSSHSNGNTFIIEANESEKIIIVCSVSHCKPPPRLKWYRKNIANTREIELLPEAAKTTVSKTLLTNSRHTLFTVESSLVLYPKSDVEYRCQVEQAGLSVPLRATASINIFRPPGAPLIEGHQSGDVVLFGEKVTLKCISTGGYPLPSVIWLRNGKLVDESYSQTGRHEVVNSVSFTVNQTDHQATYSCLVSNGLAAKPLQASVILKVLFFPTQVQINAPSEVLLLEPQGTPVTVQCLAHPASLPTSISSSSSTSTTSIRWQIDGTEVTSSNANFEMDSPSTSTSSQVYVSRTYFDVASLTMHTNLSFVVNSRQPSVRNVACIGNRYTATLREN
ncbi:cell adhesion molecule, partial [Tyrophagus putrescentiae]